jgi:hypothetical protein
MNPLNPAQFNHLHALPIPRKYLANGEDYVTLLPLTTI